MLRLLPRFSVVLGMWQVQVLHFGIFWGFFFFFFFSFFDLWFLESVDVSNISGYGGPTEYSNQPFAKHSV